MNEMLAKGCPLHAPLGAQSILMLNALRPVRPEVSSANYDLISFVLIDALALSLLSILQYDFIVENMS